MSVGQYWILGLGQPSWAQYPAAALVAFTRLFESTILKYIGVGTGGPCPPPPPPPNHLTAYWAERAQDTSCQQIGQHRNRPDYELSHEISLIKLIATDPHLLDLLLVLQPRNPLPPSPSPSHNGLVGAGMGVVWAKCGRGQTFSRAIMSLAHLTINTFLRLCKYPQCVYTAVYIWSFPLSSYYILLVCLAMQMHWGLHRPPQTVIIYITLQKLYIYCDSHLQTIHCLQLSTNHGYFMLHKQYTLPSTYYTQPSTN